MNCRHDNLPCERARRCRLSKLGTCANLHARVKCLSMGSPCGPCRKARAGFCPGFRCLVGWRRDASGRISR